MELPRRFARQRLPTQRGVGPVWVEEVCGVWGDYGVGVMSPPPSRFRNDPSGSRAAPGRKMKATREEATAM